MKPCLFSSVEGNRKKKDLKEEEKLYAYQRRISLLVSSSFYQGETLDG
jgi:hypothetical protein